MSDFEILDKKIGIEDLDAKLSYKEDITFSNNYDEVIKSNKSSVMATIAITGACLFMPNHDVLAMENYFLELDNDQNCIQKSLEYQKTLQQPLADYLEHLNGLSGFSILSKQKIRKDILSFRSLNNNWDGSGAIPMEIEVASNVMLLMELLPEDVFSKINDYYPNPNGTISMNWENNAGENVMAEIGNNTMAYFVKLSSQEPIFFNNVEINSEESKKFSKFIQAL